MSGYQGKKNIPRITVSICAIYFRCVTFVSVSVGEYCLTCEEPRD